MRKRLPKKSLWFVFGNVMIAYMTSSILIDEKMLLFPVSSPLFFFFFFFVSFLALLGFSLPSALLLLRDVGLLSSLWS